MRFAYEFHILLKIIKSCPPHPALRLIQIIEQVVVEPEDDVLAEAELDLPNVHVRDSGFLVVLAVNDEELLALFEKYDILLRGIVGYEILDAPSRYREDVEPDGGALVVVRVVQSVANRRRYYVLEPEDFARLIVIPLNWPGALYFPGALASEWLQVGEGAIDPPNDALGAILALLEDLQILLIVWIVEHS
jgi:hypothetical protein